MNIRVEELYYFTIPSFLEYVDAYTTLKQVDGKSSGYTETKQVVYEGADGLDKFLGG